MYIVTNNYIERKREQTMNRTDVERYALIAQIIDDVETLIGIDFYIYNDVEIKKTSNNQYTVNIDYEKTLITIDFNNKDEHDTSVDVVVEYGTSEREYLSYDIEYDHTCNNHIRLG